MIDKAIYVLEKESIPRWNKFLQGYYDASAINSDTFDSSVQFLNNEIMINKELNNKNIQLETATQATIIYYAFNMLDDTIGGYTEKQKKLRQAISIAINMEEFIQIFLNGRGIVAHSPIPSSIFGHQKNTYNPYLYNVVPHGKNKQKKKSLEEAKNLLKQAGYENGIKKDGKRLVVYFDTYIQSSAARPEINWLRKQINKLNIDLQVRATDYNQFRSKVSQGNYQILRWGWNADYPDPENFLFLLYGPNSEKKYKGPNHSNYDNSKFNQLFEEMFALPNNTKRLRIIKEMVHIVQEDAPWIFGFYPVAYVLFHEWYANTKPMTIGNNTLKYKRVYSDIRDEYQKKENRPPWLLLLSILLAFLILFVILHLWNRYRDNSKKKLE